MLPSSYREYLALEQAASEIFIYDPQHVPDLLQTPQYAQACGVRNLSFQADTELSVSRQRLLSERQTRLMALIGERRYSQDLGDPEIMRNLGALAAAGGRAVVYILPSRCVPPSSGPATILRFAAVPSLGAVYLPGLSGGVCLTDRQDADGHAKAFERLRRLALPTAASARLIQEIARVTVTGRSPGQA